METIREKIQVKVIHIGRCPLFIEGCKSTFLLSLNWIYSHHILDLTKGNDEQWLVKVRKGRQLEWFLHEGQRHGNAGKPNSITIKGLSSHEVKGDEAQGKKMINFLSMPPLLFQFESPFHPWRKSRIFLSFQFPFPVLVKYIYKRQIFLSTPNYQFYSHDSLLSLFLNLLW